jgi:glycosyltransferase involved in cell wall biosynthesis
MRVLFITSRFPQSLRRGDELRTYQHLRELSRRHAITLLTFAPESGSGGAVSVELRRCCERVVVVAQNRGTRLIRLARALSGSVPLQVAMNDTFAFRSALTGLLRSGEFDLAHVQLARMGETLPLLGDLPCVLDLVDALSANMARRAQYDTGPMRLLARFEAARLLPYERALCARAAAVTISTARDREALGGDLSGLHVVDNGIDPELFAFSAQPRVPGRLIFGGNLGYFPNVDAALWFAHEVLPILKQRHPGVVLDLVGARPAAALRRLAANEAGVRLVGPVADMASHLRGAEVALAPMRAGSGQQIKILEAMGCGTPVVASSFAAAGLEAVAGRDLLVADAAGDFAAQVSRLLDDRRLAGGVAASARALVERRYTWAHSARAIESLWRAAAGQSDGIGTVDAYSASPEET